MSQKQKGSMAGNDPHRRNQVQIINVDVVKRKIVDKLGTNNPQKLSHP
jgi:hypothetical protein